MTEPIKHEESIPEGLPNEGRPYIQIVIKADNTLGIYGSINDKILAYGLLESARDAIAVHIDKAVKSQIQHPPHRIMDFLRNGK